MATYELPCGHTRSAQNKLAVEEQTTGELFGGQNSENGKNKIENKNCRTAL